MPFKDPDRFREWNRSYQRARDAHAAHTRVSLEEQIIHVVLEKPCQHDTLSLYARFRERGFSLPALTRAVKGLLRGGVLCWRVQGSENPGVWRPGLMLTNRGQEVFAPPAGQPEGDRADAPTEGPGEHMRT